jgi:hypothetical protein
VGYEPERGRGVGPVRFEVYALATQHRQIEDAVSREPPTSTDDHRDASDERGERESGMTA